MLLLAWMSQRLTALRLYSVLQSTARPGILDISGENGNTLYRKHIDETEYKDAVGQLFYTNYKSTLDPHPLSNLMSIWLSEGMVHLCPCS